MLHAHRILPYGQWPDERSRGTVTLAADDRHVRRIRIATDRGEDVLVDLSEAAYLGDGDALILEEGGYVVVRAAVEDLVEIKAGPGQLARIAWHIGNRHFPAELRDDCILIHDDHVMVDMLVGLGATVRRVRAPFRPEGGAYDNVGEHGHSHGAGGHHHHHGNGHDHH
jgi:urease accessory protein